MGEYFFDSMIIFFACIFLIFHKIYFIRLFIHIFSRENIELTNLFCCLNKILVLFTKSLVQQKTITNSTNKFVEKTKYLFGQQKNFVSSISTIRLANTATFVSPWTRIKLSRKQSEHGNHASWKSTSLPFG